MSSKPALPSGPRGYPFIGILHKMWRDPLQFFAQVSREYGDIALLDFGSRHAFLVHDPAQIQYVLQDNNNNYRKSTTVKIVDRVLGQGLATAEGDVWLQQRRLMQPAFHHKRLGGLVDAITSQTEAILPQWDAAARSSTPLNIAEEMMRLALHILFKAMFGSDIGSNVDELGHAWTVVLKHFNSQAWALFQIPEEWPTPGNRRFQRALELLEGTVYRLMEERQRNGRADDDLLGVLLAAQDVETGIGMSTRQVRDEVMTLFVAGHETSANVLAWAGARPPSPICLTCVTRGW